MRLDIAVAIVSLLFASLCPAQTKPKPKPRTAPKLVAKTDAKPSIDRGKVAGRTYTNSTFGFEITFPDTWLIPGDDFEAYMKKQGFDLGLKAPDSLPPASKAKVNSALKRVHILLTAYRSMPGSTDNAIVRISVEDLTANPQIKDAVDYFDAVRGMYKTMKLPADFKYGETGAEKLGSMQFGYIDTTSKAGRKRMYATVRSGFAILFTLSYTSDTDLETLRGVLAGGKFSLK